MTFLYESIIEYGFSLRNGAQDDFYMKLASIATSIWKVHRRLLFCMEI